MDGQRRKQLWQAIRARVNDSSRDGWAHAACTACVAVLGVDAATITLRSSVRTQELLGASDPWGAGLVERQYTAGSEHSPTAPSIPPK